MSDSVGRRRGPQFGMVDPAVVRDETLPKNVKTLYTYFTTWCGETRSAFPGRARIARETGLSLSTVDVTKKLGKTIGLWEIEYRPDKRNPNAQTSNRYWLNDFGGGYVPGTGPGARQKGKPRGRAAAKTRKDDTPETDQDDAHVPDANSRTPSQNLGEDPSQKLGHPLPKSGTYLDNGPRQARRQTRSTDTVPSAAHQQAGEPERTAARTPTLQPPADFADRPIKAARGWLVGATIKALGTVGIEIDDTARSYLGQQLMVVTRSRRKTARHDLVDLIRAELADPQRFAAKLRAGRPIVLPPMPDFDADDFECDEHIATYVGQVLSQDGVGVATMSAITGQLASGVHPKAIVNDALARERGHKPNEWE